MLAQLAGDYSQVDKFNFEGVAMMISGRYPEAELCFINALKLSPDDANIQKNLEAAPLPCYLPTDLAFAEAIHATYENRDLPGTAPKFDWKVKQQVKEWTENGQKAVNHFVMPYVPSDYMSPGSTDVGDVSWLTPTAQFNAATWPSNCPGHSWQMVSTGKTSFAHKAMLYAGMVLAGTAVDLMTDPAILKEAHAEFAVTAAEGYDCPLEPDLVAEPAAI
jgi:aminobenzoyl-glutamate utilization protein B